jgi:hypothetical protein
MSDSELSDAPSAALPSDLDLEQALRRVVRNAFKAEDEPAITVSSVRTSAEEALGLQPGFYKGDGKWKEKSKGIIHEAFVC